VRSALLAAARRLAFMPGAGRVRRDLTDETVRFWPVFAWLLVYRYRARPLEIVRIVDGRRDVSALFQRER
jgi:plasmid stabilization system protein ParE